MIAMDYFFRYQKTTFSLEINACVKETFYLPRNWIHLLQNFFPGMHISRMYAKPWKELEKFSLFNRVNNFFKYVNFTSSHTKKLKLSKLEYYSLSLCGKVNFSVIHPTRITIYSFWRTIPLAQGCCKLS